MSIVGFVTTVALPPALAFLIHAIIGRLWPQNKIAVAVVASLFASLMTVLLVRHGSSWWDGATMIAVLISLFSVHPYFNFFLLSETARRIHVLRCVREGKTLEDYSPELVLQVRLKRLEAAGVVTFQHNVLRANPSALVLLAVVIRALERLVFPGRFNRPTSHPSASLREGADECGR